MPRVLVAIGTRPEAIKLAPVITELRRDPHTFEVVVGLTGQHDELVAQVLDVFDIRPDFNLRLMHPNQDLSSLTGRILERMSIALRDTQPDVVLVQGDTTTVFATALAAFYEKIPVGHVEAGLRTDDKYQPFPEEIFRRLADQVSDLCFAPTEENRRNLLKSGIEPERVFVTGNTVVDALQEISGRMWRPPADLPPLGANVVLVTVHRRENHGQPMQNVFSAMRVLARDFPDHQFLFPVHPNPNVQLAAHRALGEVPNVHLLKPLDYVSFVHLMKRSRIILTDSGGVQEEAPSFHRPVLILRNKTEREELVRAGGARLVGTDPELIVAEASRLLSDSDYYASMASVANPFGDGTASQKIAETLRDFFQNGRHHIHTLTSVAGAG